MGHLSLRKELRPLLQKPLGELICGSEADVVDRITKLVIEKKPPRLISVGDRVSRLLSKNSVQTDLKIIDNIEMREPAEHYQFEAPHIFKVLNPPGGIEDVVWPVMDEALKKQDSLIIVEGEEDLLTLVAISQSPEGSLIIYGQPKQGVVAVTANSRMKKKVDLILKSMDRRS
ncbi:GTP-dependent dephospho-CoA kinase family protein [[Eubacterium] cellulosolvens]